MQSLIKAFFIFMLLLLNTNIYASYYGTFEVIAEVVSKNGDSYKLVQIAEKETTGGRGSSQEYSFYLFPKPIEKYNNLPPNLKIGDLVKLNKTLSFGTPSKERAGHSEKYVFSGISSKNIKKERTRVINNWQPGIKKGFYFKAAKPFEKLATSSHMISANGIKGSQGTLQLTISFTSDFSGDYNQKNIRKYFSDSHYNLFINKAPIEIQTFFRNGTRFFGKAYKQDTPNTAGIGKPDKDGFVFEIDKIRNGIMYGYFKGKIDKSSVFFNPPNNFKAISYKIRFEIPMP